MGNHLRSCSQTVETNEKEGGKKKRMEWRVQAIVRKACGGGSGRDGGAGGEGGLGLGDLPG